MCACRFTYCWNHCGGTSLVGVNPRVVQHLHDGGAVSRVLLQGLCVWLKSSTGQCSISMMVGLFKEQHRATDGCSKSAGAAPATQCSHTALKQCSHTAFKFCKSAVAALATQCSYTALKQCSQTAFISAKVQGPHQQRNTATQR